MDKQKREILEKIFLGGVAAVDPEKVVRGCLTRTGANLQIGSMRYCLADFANIYLIGAGKAAAPMAKAVEEQLDDFLTGGLVIVKYGHGVPLHKIRVMEAGHPLPDAAGAQATNSIVTLLKGCTERNLVICVFSGGGSALLTSPVEPVSLADKQLTTQLLLECGATINEINSIRKHLSRVKGGRLAKAAHPAKVAALFLSDVIDDPLPVIASGPTVSDPTTYADCMRIFKKYQLPRQLPPTVVAVFEKGLTGLTPETPKADDPVFGNVQNLIVGNNKAALAAAAKVATANGYASMILSSRIQGEAKEVAGVLTAIAREVRGSGHPLRAPACLLAGGETTVTVKGGGKGGRNQELALSAAIALDGCHGIYMLSAGTDGTDGPTDAAGAFADGETCQEARRLGLHPPTFLAHHDAYHFFQDLGLLLQTGPTRTNVMDIICLLID